MYSYILVFVIVVLLVYYLTKKNRYWEDQNAPTSNISDFSQFLSFVFQRKPMVLWLQEIYNSVNGRYICSMQFGKPGIMIKDPELCKQILIKYFDHFTNRQTFSVSEDLDPFFGKNLLSLKGQQWKNMRSILSPAFTSSKMRGMFKLMQESAEQFVEYFSKNLANEDTLTMEMKETFTRYTNDVIANCVFGIKCDSLENKENEFFVSAKELSFSGKGKTLKLFGIMLIPKIMKFFNISLVHKDITNYFANIVTENILIREKEGIVRMDMIHLLMEARKGKLKHDNKTEEDDISFASVSETPSEENGVAEELTIKDIISNTLLFFAAGYDTTATVLTFLSYELAVSPDVQTKLQNEIDETLQDCDGKLTYDILLKMKYLDMVVCEILRLWPPGIATDRQCVKPFVIEPELPNESPLRIDKDIVVTIPIYCIHRDPKYYENPDKFDPERFSDENKKNIQPFTYIPFGLGPRNCISSRFGLLEVKTLIFYLLSKFSFVVIEKTDIPFKLSKGQFNVNAENGCWLGIRKRE